MLLNVLAFSSLKAGSELQRHWTVSFVTNIKVTVRREYERKNGCLSRGPTGRSGQDLSFMWG